MSIIIGSARIDERGKLSGGIAGDQKQLTASDYKGEVSMQEFYIHKKGWYVIRPKNPAIGLKIANAMKTACNNPNIGYDQGQRLGIISTGTATKVKTECDCSSLVRQCVKEASGIDVGNFTTFNECQVLLASGLFEKHSYVSGMVLKPGDILVTKTKGHTAVVVSVSISTTALPTLKVGNRGGYVKELQRLLNKNGAKLEVDGIFGPLTSLAVISFQKTHGLNGDGIVGVNTWKALNAS